MSAKIASVVRYVFVSTMVTGLIVAGLESASGSEERLGLSECGWEGNPCELAPLVVNAPRVPQDGVSETLIAKR
ncbi:MAG TPA: hypothetical protein VK420_11640 [Longimicrobium sp.]|nr:hypothetical protein [Longimicrobium sp.]